MAGQSGQSGQSRQSSGLDLPPDTYDGPAEVVAADGRTCVVEVRLRGHFEPIDGRFHWYGRIARDDRFDATYTSGDLALLRVGEAPWVGATGRISDLDPWGRYRITGTGRPPWLH